MTPKEQRLAIAEACGWSEIRQGTSCLIGTAPDGRIAWEMPDYLTDLNAMHEAEKILTEEQFCEWGEQLQEILNPEDKRMGMKFYHLLSIIAHATAAQRAEAFCRTLWPEKFGL